MDSEEIKEKYRFVWTIDEYRDFSPGEHAVDKVGLIDLLRKRDVKTVLDAGCGSGKLMRKLIEECGNEFVVHGFDIAENCLDSYFDDKDDILTVGVLWDSTDFYKTYDAIICTDVLEHIPTEKMASVLSNFYSCTRRFCYLAIALFPDGFGPKLLGESLHLTVKEPGWWLEQIKNAGFEKVHSVTEKHTSGQDMWLHVFIFKVSNKERKGPQ